MLIENEVQSSRLHRARQLVTTLLMEMPDATERVVDFAKRTACEQHPEATTMCANALLEAGLQGDRWESMADWVPQQPETAHWPADLNSQLARADAAARLETRRRKNHNHLKTFPDLAPVPTGASETTRDGSSGERDTPGVNRR